MTVYQAATAVFVGLLVVGLASLFAKNPRAPRTPEAKMRHDGEKRAVRGNQADVHSSNRGTLHLTGNFVRAFGAR